MSAPSPEPRSLWNRATVRLTVGIVASWTLPGANLAPWVCRHCSYDMRAGGARRADPHARCPECGRPWDAEDDAEGDTKPSA
jgi:hypothetical protein